MTDTIESKVIEKLKAKRIDYYEASSGLRLVLMKDGTLWWSTPDPYIPTPQTANDAMVEFLK